MAIARKSTDLWGYVQRGLLEEVAPTNTVRLFAPTLHLREVSDTGWHFERNAQRAEAHFAGLVAAIAGGRTRRAKRLRAAWLHDVHSDRVAHTREFASRTGLRLEPIGKGPIVDLATVHYRDRLPWVVTPLAPYQDERLPLRSATVVEEWDRSGDLFDRYYIADEPRTTSLHTHCLIGAISTDGRCSDWFVLDRWAS